MSDFNQNENTQNSTNPEPEIGAPESVSQNTQPEVSEGKERSIGSMVAIIIIIVIIIIGGLYFWGKTINDIGINNVPTADDILKQPDETINDLNMQGTSDELTDIEADLSATDLEGLDVEFGEIDAELGL